MGTNTIIMMSTSQQILFKQIFILSYCGNFREGNGNPLQYSCLENPMDGGAWWAPVHGVARSQTRLNDFTLNFHFHALEKEMATHSSVLAWRIPGTGEPGGSDTQAFRHQLCYSVARRPQAGQLGSLSL